MPQKITVPVCESPLCKMKGMGLHYHDGTEIFVVERCTDHFKYPVGFINGIELSVFTIDDVDKNAIV